MTRPGLLGGARRVWLAARLLRRERSLWVWCALPFAINLLLFTLAIAAFVGWGYEPLVEALRAPLSTPEPDSWLQWLWVGPLRALAWMVQWLVILLVALLVYFLFTTVGSVLASPFLEVLSQRVERLQTGSVAQGAGGVRGALRVLLQEARRMAFFALGLVVLLVLGLVPGLQPVSAVAVLLFSTLFLSLDYTAYLLDRREVPFSARRAWLWQNRRPLLGFGSAALGTFVVPGVNFLALPLLVTAGTLLALELGPPAEGATPG